MHKHHIVFRSQGGLDFRLNLINLTYEQHEGNHGPHRNRKVDLILKTDLQDQLYKIFSKDEYTITEIAERLEKSVKYIEKHFRSVPQAAGLYKREDLIRKLMGGKIY
jgi:DNA-binding CsgD family transcriptional regulator